MIDALRPAGVGCGHARGTNGAAKPKRRKPTHLAEESAAPVPDEHNWAYAE